MIVNLHDYEEQAAKIIPPDRLAYIRGGAGDGISLAADRRLFDSIHLVPRFFNQDMRSHLISTRLSLLGIDTSSMHRARACAARACS